MAEQRTDDQHTVRPRTIPWSSPPEDALFAHPYLDVDEWRDAPVRHRYVHGGFVGTDTRFSCYFPPPERYEGRFFQHLTPVPDSEHLAQHASGEEDRIGFAISSGAYFVETNGGGQGAGRMLNPDPTVGAYRANAMCAEYSRQVAAALLGGERPFGYAYGGSGGAFRTMGGAENTTGVWDGVVPYVNGSPVAIPNVFTVRMHALRVLKERFPQIVDAVDAGGSGDMYAGLDGAERAAFREVTAMGFPPRSWFGHRTMGPHAFSLLFQGMVLVDPQYFEDFWTVPGHLGADDPQSLAADLIRHDTTVVEPISAEEAGRIGLHDGPQAGRPRGGVDDAWQVMTDPAGAEIPVGFRVADTHGRADATLADLIVISGAAAGLRLQVRAVQTDAQGDVVIIDRSDERAALVRPGDTVRVDNANAIAAQTYHRHQDPGPEYPMWEQFRLPDGTPRYPQRPVQLGPMFTVGASGTLPSGRFGGRMILVASLLDREAYPWQADWYRSKAAEHLGDQLDDRFRLWFTDNALHGDVEQQEDPARTVSYLGMLHQALRDLSAWVERGVAAPRSTQYRVVDGQLQVPPTAAERGGIQPVVTLHANGVSRAEVGVGQMVSLTAMAEVPTGTGSIVAVEWDLGGTGRFTAAPLPDPAKEHITLTMTHAFTAPGTYFPVVRVAAQRGGDRTSRFARVQNLARVRVVVS